MQSQLVFPAEQNPIQKFIDLYKFYMVRNPVRFAFAELLSSRILRERKQGEDEDPTDCGAQVAEEVPRAVRRAEQAAGRPE